MIGGLKECGTFAGEKKGTFFLVIFEGLSGGFVLESWFFVLVKLSD